MCLFESIFICICCYLAVTCIVWGKIGNSMFEFFSFSCRVRWEAFQAFLAVIYFYAGGRKAKTSMPPLPSVLPLPLLPSHMREKEGREPLLPAKDLSLRPVGVLKPMVNPLDSGFHLHAEGTERASAPPPPTLHVHSFKLLQATGFKITWRSLRR